MAISCGDPCGIGTEVVLGALATLRPRRFAAVVIGDRALIPARIARAQPRALPPLRPGELVAVEASELGRDDRRPGRPGLPAGRAQLAAIDAALELVLAGGADAIVTAPVSKEAISRAAPSIGFRGHTEYLAKRSGAGPIAMMFHGPRLNVALATTHLPLAAVPHALTTARIVEVGRLLNRAMRSLFGVRRPRIGVCALNPHAGEGGLLGGEEIELVAPAVDELGAVGRFVGPLPADAAFRQAATGRIDAVVALYHDQATVPVKLLDFGRSVNLTLGLPFLRTSVDHGVAYDIAGKNRADPTSMRAAIRLAAKISSERRDFAGM
ncbi:MAG: 4-hydroxythreonine-4-phosphate dehydrogenase PdxA [Deltaproteobacteria bacterium]|nr:4-hydroxythreonine-4-phosphate dehydrogenase PdxA [Deltaproteobacteria bacterium]